MVVAAKRGGAVIHAAHLVPSRTRVDVDCVVRRHLGAHRVSFVSRETATGAIGMEHGGITPVGLPRNWALLVDAAVVTGWVPAGSGRRADPADQGLRAAAPRDRLECLGKAQALGRRAQGATAVSAAPRHAAPPAGLGAGQPIRSTTCEGSGYTRSVGSRAWAADRSPAAMAACAAWASAVTSRMPVIHSST